MPEGQPTHKSNFRILGIHLAGAGTRRTALTRASVTLGAIHSGLVEGDDHAAFANAVHSWRPDLPVAAGTAPETPLIWEAYYGQVGPSPRVDSDTHLLTSIDDLGGADIFCIDAPLSLPPCLRCGQACPSPQQGCLLPEAVAMQALWEQARQGQRQKRLRPAQPYLERFFEVYARTNFRHPSLGHGYEFEPVLGSGRAPLTARGIWLARNLATRFPGALILETQSQVSSLGWAVQAGFRAQSPGALKLALSSKHERRLLMKRIESKHLAHFSPGLSHDLRDDLSDRFEVFLAAMCCMSAWGMLTGGGFVSEDLMRWNEDPWKGWACLPKEVCLHDWCQ